MKGWILYKYAENKLTKADYGTTRLMEAAAARGMTLNVYCPDEFELVVTDDTKSILLNDVRVPIPDFILPRIGAETSYFALAIVRQLEKLGVRSCNTADTIATVKDKMYMSQLLAQNGLPTPKTMLVKFPVSIEVVKRELGFPVVIKNNSGAKGYGVHLCESAASFKDLMELISSHSSNNQIILQEFIANSYGRDLRVFVLGGNVIGCMKRSSKDNFKANYSLGGDVESFPLTAEIEQLALATARLFRLEIAGIDLLFGKDVFKVCEANSSPGFKGMEQATGVDIAGKILDYVHTKMTC